MLCGLAQVARDGLGGSCETGEAMARSQIDIFRSKNQELKLKVSEDF